MDIKQLKTLVKKDVLEKSDHKNLNQKTEAFETLNPKAENIARVIYDRLFPNLGTLKK